MTTMTSHICDEEMMALAEGELPQSEAQAAELHLQECAECAARLVAWRHATRPLEETLASWTVEPVPMRVERVVLGARAGRHEGSRSLIALFRGADRWRLSAGAAAGLMVALVVVGIIAAHQQPRHADTYIAQQETALSPTLPSSQATRAEAVRSRKEKSEPSQPGGVAGVSGSDVGGIAGGSVGQFAATAPPPAPSPVMEAKPAAPRVAGGGGQHDLASRSTAPLAPMIARTAMLNLTVDNVDRERVVVEGLLARYGGYAAQMQVNTPAVGPRSLTASLRVPATDLAQALADLRTLGHVESESQSGEDVGQDHADLEARLNTARSTEDRLRGILREHTGSVSDVLEVEEQIASTRENIESMEAELDGMEHRVRYSTVELQLSEASAKPPARTLGGRLGQSLTAGWNNAEWLVVGLVLWLAEEGPAIAVVLLLLGLPGVWLWRRYQRERSPK